MVVSSLSFASLAGWWGRGGWGQAAGQAGVVAVPEGLLDLGAGGAEVLRLAGEVVDCDVELGLVDVLLELVVGGVDADEAVGGAVERVGLVVDLLGDGVAGVLARVAGGGADVEQRGVDLGRALRVLELGDGLAELLAVRRGPCRPRRRARRRS